MWHFRWGWGGGIAELHIGEWGDLPKCLVTIFEHYKTKFHHAKAMYFKKIGLKSALKSVT
jgi:hypothetical protein